MSELPDKSDVDITKSDELQDLFRALSTIQSNALVRVMRGRDNDDMIQIAIKETERLQAFAREGSRCGPGEVWDEILGRCV